MQVSGVRAAAVVALALLGLVLALPGFVQNAAAASAVSGAKPRIVWMRLSRSGTLPAAGARVKVSVKVRNARRCTFLYQTKPNSSLHPIRTVSCADGRGSATAPAIRNPSQSKVWLTYAVRVTGAGRTSTHRMRLAEAAAAAPPPKSKVTAALTLTPQTVSYTGGQVTFGYSSSNATSCTLSVSPTLWSGSNPVSVPCTGTYQPEIAKSASAEQWTITFTATGATGQATTQQTLVQQAPPFQESPNWAGYVVPSSNIITETSGTFTVPTLNCLQTPAASEATWVGIGGDGNSSGDLLQTGVESDCSGGLQTSNPAWWEEFPEVPGIDFNGMPVSPGDEMQAFVYWASGTTWETCLEDLTTGISGLMVTGEGWGVTTGGCASTFTEQGSTATLTYAGGTTAEWIVEDFDRNSTEVPFADFGTVSFGDLTTSLSSWSLTPDEQWGIVQGGSVLGSALSPLRRWLLRYLYRHGVWLKPISDTRVARVRLRSWRGSNTSRSPAPWPCDSIPDHLWWPGCDRPERNAWESAVCEESASAWPTECPPFAAFSRPFSPNPPHP